MSNASILVVNLIIPHTILQGLLHLPPVALILQDTKSDVTCDIPISLPHTEHVGPSCVRCARMPPQQHCPQCAHCSLHLQPVWPKSFASTFVAPASFVLAYLHISEPPRRRVAPVQTRSNVCPAVGAHSGSCHPQSSSEVCS